MLTVKVKICGIRTLEAALASVESGADFLGFNFVKNSKRYIKPEEAGKIIKGLMMKDKGLKFNIVGVFQNQPIGEVNRIAKMLNLDFVQLHGEEDEKYIKQVTTKVIKTIVIPTEEARRVEGSASSYISVELDPSTSLRSARDDSIAYYLLDRQIQGEGDMVNLEQAAEIAKNFPIFLAGGLTPGNVAEVVQKVRPFAVDVAGGVETNGKQDCNKIRALINIVKQFSYNGS